MTAPAIPVTVRDRAMWALLGLHLLALFVGTLMPDHTRVTLSNAVSTRLPLSTMAHVALFASLALLLTRAPFAWRPPRILGLALFLALLTEGLQFFTPDRHPRWTDVGFDLSGATAGLGLAALLSLCLARP